MFRDVESIFEKNRSGILNSIIVELILGDVDTDKDGEAFRHSETSFQLIWLKSKSMGLVNQTSQGDAKNQPTYCD